MIEMVAVFFNDIVQAIGDFFIWLAELAVRIGQINLEADGITVVMGTFRWLVGDVVYLLIVTALYIGAGATIIRLAPTVLAMWKKFSPFH